MAAQTANVVSPASNPLNEYLTERQLAAAIGTSLRSLRRWHVLRVGPPRTKLGRSILYPKEGVAAWLAARTQAPCRTSRRSAR